MGHVVDRWTVPGPTGRRVKGPRHGSGKRWRARWVEPGGAERSRSFTTKDAAEAHLAKVDVDVRAGTYVRDTAVTFEAYARHWLGEQLHQRPGTAAQARSKLELHAFPVIGHLPLARVHRSDVQRVVSQASVLGPDARRILYVYVRAVFAAAVEDRLVQVSPCRKINLPQAVRSRITPLTPAQVEAVAGAMTPHLVGAVWFCAGTGVRPGEMRGLTVDRLEGDRVRIDRQLSEESSAHRPVWGPLKTDESPRTIRLAPVTHRALVEHLEAFPPGPSGLVFASTRGRALARSTIGSAWQAATEGMGLGGRSGWHELRHHHASLLIAAGCSPRAVADRLGHADPSVTLRVYSHLWPSDEARMLDAVEQAYTHHGDL
jgi:integrase